MCGASSWYTGRVTLSDPAGTIVPNGRSPEGPRDGVTLQHAEVPPGKARSGRHFPARIEQTHARVNQSDGVRAWVFVRRSTGATSPPPAGRTPTPGTSSTWA